MKKFLILISVMMICFSSFSAFAVQDTVWTRFNYPWLISNAVFSPDGNYIYATGGYNTTRLYQYDLNGKLITTNDTVGGIKQFSQDGKYFWNLVGDKYEFATMKRIDSIPYVSGYKPIGFNINEEEDIGVAFPALSEGLDGNYLYFYKPSNMSFLKKSSFPSMGQQFYCASITKDAKYYAAAMCKITVDNDGVYKYYYTCVIQDINTFETIKLLPDNDSILRVTSLKFSQDGKYLAVANERKLFLYSSGDWSLVHTFDYTQTVCGVNSFLFSTDNATLYIGDGIDKINIDSKKVDHTYNYTTESSFINESFDRRYLVSEADAGTYLVLLDNTISGIDYEQTNAHNITLSPNPTKDELFVNIEVSDSQTLVYSISSVEGNTVVPNMKKELTAGVNQLVIKVSEFTSGVYFFNATLDGQTKSYKFVVEK